MSDPTVLGCDQIYVPYGIILLLLHTVYMGRAMIEKHLAGQAVKKSDFSTERKLYILKHRFLDLRHRPGCSGLVPRAHFCCGVPPGPKEK